MDKMKEYYFRRKERGEGTDQQVSSKTAFLVVVVLDTFRPHGSCASQKKPLLPIKLWRKREIQIGVVKLLWCCVTWSESQLCKLSVACKEIEMGLMSPKAQVRA